MPYPNLNPPGLPPIPPELHDQITKQLGPRPDVSPTYHILGFPLNYDSSSRSQQAAGAWDEAYKVQQSRALNPLSVGQIAEPQRSQLATPDQYLHPGYQSEVPQVTMAPLSPPSFRQQPEPQNFLPPSMTPPPQGPLSLSPGPQMPPSLDPQKPANPAQRQAFESSIQLASKWPPGTASSVKYNQKLQDQVRALMYQNPGMDPDQALATARANVSGLEDVQHANRREDRLDTGLAERKRHYGMQEDLAQKRLDAMVNQHKDNLEQKIKAYREAQSKKGSDRDLQRRRVEAMEALNQMRGAYLMMKSNPDLPPEAMDELHRKIADLNDMELSFREEPGFLGFGTNTVPTLKPKPKSAAPQGAAPQGEVLPGRGGKQYRYVGPVGTPDEATQRKNKANYQEVQ